MQRLSLIGLAVAVAGLSIACDDTEILGVAVRDGNELKLVDARGEVTQDGSAIEITITGWSNPDCNVADDEVSVTAVIRVTDATRVSLGVPTDVTEADAPLEVVLSMGSMGRICSQDCQDPVYTLTGTVTLDELSPTRACGSIDLQLQGDIPASGQLDQAYQRDSTLSLTWNGFCAPTDIDHCR